LILRQFYELVINEGIANDPRGKSVVEKELKSKKKKFNGLSEKDKKYFDPETLKNPYADSRILNDTGRRDIKNILVGIDIETPEILLAEQLKNNKIAEIDLLFSHHPQGFAYASFYEVMSMQADIFSKYGVPINVAESLLEERIKEVSRKVMPQNHTRAVDAAKLLGYSFMCTHTASDNCVATYLQNIFDSKVPERVGDIIDLLMEIPEYKRASENKNGPKSIHGSHERKVGKVFVDMTGGTEGAEDLLEKLSQAGVGTIVGMHMDEKHYNKAREHHLNVVIAGHIASDSVGMNILLNKAQKKFGDLNIICCSGFNRFKH